MLPPADREKRAFGVSELVMAKSLSKADGLRAASKLAGGLGNYPSSPGETTPVTKEGPP